MVRSSLHSLFLAMLTVFAAFVFPCQACPPEAFLELVDPIEPEIPAAEWKTWTLEKWNSLSGKTLRLENEGTVVRQSILAFKDFSAPEQKLVRLILDASQKKKYINRNKAHYAEAAEKIDALVNILKIDRATLTSLVDRLTKGDRVEVGAWIIETKSGQKVAGLFTSTGTHGLTEEDSQKALNGLMASHKLAPSDIQDILQFHNHPVVSPASPTDSEAALHLKNQLREHGSSAGVWYYAICEVESTPVLFHIGF